AGIRRRGGLSRRHRGVVRLSAARSRAADRGLSRHRSRRARAAVDRARPATRLRPRLPPAAARARRHSARVAAASQLRRLASPYYHHRLQGGEGDMLIGKALWTHLNEKAHIGAMAAVLGKHPDLLYAPLEIKGDAEIHALSRCQMVLTEAKKRAQTEFQAALAASGLTLAAARERMDGLPRLRRATYRIPRHGWIGVGANLVSQLRRERAS